jgi:WD40 repeat protein
MWRFPLLKERAIIILCLMVFCCGCGMDDLPDDEERNVTKEVLDACVNRLGAQMVFNTRIAYVPSNVTPMQIHVMSFGGFDTGKLTQELSGNNFQPTWSPDGTKIAFVSDRDTQNEIYTMNANGKNSKRLTDDPGDDVSPAWSPSGSKIAFVSDRDGQKEIYIIDADGGNSRRLTYALGDDVSPAWSPNGSEIAFVSNRDGQDGIYIMNADRKVERLLVEGSPPLTWSPASQEYPSGLISYSHLGYLKLYDFAKSESLGMKLEYRDSFSDEIVEHLTWSPDGKGIFVSDLGMGRIYTYEAAEDIYYYCYYVSSYYGVTQPAWSPFLSK